MLSGRGRDSSFLRPQQFYKKRLSLPLQLLPLHSMQDFFITIGFGVLYLLACIAWSAGVGQLATHVPNELRRYASDCLGCMETDIASGIGSLQTYGLPAISLVSVLV